MDELEMSYLVGLIHPGCLAYRNGNELAPDSVFM